MLEVVNNCSFPIAFESTEKNDLLPEKKKEKNHSGIFYYFFFFFFSVDLPLYFPRDQPTLTFQSVYHFTNSGQLYSQAQKNYPYSPRWDGNEMAKRAK